MKGKTRSLPFPVLDVEEDSWEVRGRQESKRFNLELGKWLQKYSENGGKKLVEMAFNLKNKTVLYFTSKMG